MELKIEDLKLTINGVALEAEDQKDVYLVEGTLTVRRALLKDPGYGSGFPCIQYVFKVDVKKSDLVEIFFENMAYRPARLKINGTNIEPVSENQVKGMGI